MLKKCLLVTLLFLVGCSTPTAPVVATITPTVLASATPAVTATQTTIVPSITPTKQPRPQEQDEYGNTISVDQAKLMDVKAGSRVEDAITVTSVNAKGYTFPGYLCLLDKSPYGIGHTTDDAGGIIPGTSFTTGIIFNADAKPGEYNCLLTMRLVIDATMNTIVHANLKIIVK